MTSSPAESQEKAIQQGHENDPLWVRTILAVGASILLLSFFAMTVVAFIVKSHKDISSQESKPSQEWSRQAVDPGVKVDQSLERLRSEAVAQQQLNEYHWQNETHDIARIPIERAIEILAQKDLQIAFPESKSSPSMNETQESETLPNDQGNVQQGGKP